MYLAVNVTIAIKVNANVRSPDIIFSNFFVVLKVFPALTKITVIGSIPIRLKKKKTEVLVFVKPNKRFMI